MKAILLILTVFTFYVSSAQPKEYYNKQFKWKITIPASFDSVPVAVWNQMRNRGTSAIEETYDGKIEDQSQTLFVVRSDMFNYFESNFQPFDTTKDGPYEETYKAVNDMMYGTFKAQMPRAVLDSASSFETIDGLQFHKFTVTVTIPQKMVMEALMYSRLFGKYEFSLNIMATNGEKKETLLKAWRTSTFGKQ